MEKLNLRSVKDAPSFEIWIAQPENSHFVSRILSSHGFSNTILTPFAHMVFHAALAPCRSDSSEFPGLAHVSRVVRETRFHMPWPERAHLPEHGLFKAERGFLVGAIDAICEWQGKYYVLDWKTDTLTHYAAENCYKHMHENYNLQAQIYTLALARFLNAHSEESFNACIGGHIYVFARAPSPIAVSARVSFHEFVAFQESLQNASGLSLSQPSTQKEFAP
jgi:hypothetical protein